MAYNLDCYETGMRRTAKGLVWAACLGAQPAQEAEAVSLMADFLRRSIIWTGLPSVNSGWIIPLSFFHRQSSTRQERGLTICQVLKPRGTTHLI